MYDPKCFIKTGTDKGIGQRLIGFCVCVSVVVRRFATVTFLFICSKFLQASSDLVGQNMEATIQRLLRFRVRQGRCCVDLL